MIEPDLQNADESRGALQALYRTTSRSNSGPNALSSDLDSELSEASVILSEAKDLVGAKPVASPHSAWPICIASNWDTTANSRALIAIARHAIVEMAVAVQGSRWLVAGHSGSTLPFRKRIE